MDVLAKLSLAINVTAGIKPKFAASGSIGGSSRRKFLLKY